MTVVAPHYQVSFLAYCATQVCQADGKKLRSFPMYLMSTGRQGNDISTYLFICPCDGPLPFGSCPENNWKLVCSCWRNYRVVWLSRVETGAHPSVHWHKVVSCRVMCVCCFLPEECAGEFLRLLLFLIKCFPTCQCCYQWKYLGDLLDLYNHSWIILAVVRLGSSISDTQHCSVGMQVSSWILLVLNFYSNHIHRSDT